MIKYDNGGCEFRGSKIDLMSELTVIIKHMVEQGALTDSDLDLLVATVRKPVDEIMSENKEFFKKMGPLEKFALSALGYIDPTELASLFDD